MRFVNFLACVMAACFLGGAAHASTVSVTFGGTIDYILNDTSYQPVHWNLGDRLNATYVLNYAQASDSPSQTRGSYPVVSGTVSNVTTGQSYILEIPGITLINATYDQFSIGGTIEKSAGFFDVGGGRADPSLFGSTSLSQITEAFLTPPNNYSIGFYLITANTSICTYCEISAPIDSVSFTDITAVAVPATLPLMALGLAGLGFAGRRRKV